MAGPEDEHAPGGEPEGPQRPASARSWAAGAHLAGFAWLVGIPGPIGPLIVWLLKRGQDPFVEDQGKEALNFQISVLVYLLVLFLLGLAWMVTLAGSQMPRVSAVAGLAFLAVVAFVLLLVAVVFTVVAGYKASEGHAWRYPLTIRFVS